MNCKLINQRYLREGKCWTWESGKEVAFGNKSEFSWKNNNKRQWRSFNSLICITCSEKLIGVWIDFPEEHSKLTFQKELNKTIFSDIIRSSLETDLNYKHDSSVLVLAISPNKIKFFFVWKNLSKIVVCGVSRILTQKNCKLNHFIGGFKSRFSHVCEIIWYSNFP